MGETIFVCELCKKKYLEGTKCKKCKAKLVESCHKCVESVADCVCNS